MTINNRTLGTAAGVLSVLAAAVRLATIIPGWLASPAIAEQIYFGIDLLLTLGLIGMVVELDGFRTPIGMLGFLSALVGLLVIRTGPRLAGASAYQAGSALIAIGLAMAGVSLVRTRGLARTAGLAWIASLGAGLIAANGLSVALTAAAVLFCIGFAAGGIALVRETARR